MRTVVKILLFLSIFSLTIFSADYYFPYIVSKVFPFRFFVEVATIVWLINILLTRTLRFRFSEPIVKAIFIFSGALLASTLFGANPMFSFWSNFERSEGLFSFLHYLAFFVLILDVFVLDDYYRLIKFFLLLSPLIAYFRFSSFLDPVTHSYGRVFGVFGNPSYLAAFLIFMFGFGLLLIFRNIEVARATKDSLLIGENILWVGILLSNIPAFILTGTRGAYIGLFVGILCLLIFLARKGEGVYKKIASYGLIGVCLGVLAFGFLVARTNVIPQNLRDPSTLFFRFSTWGSAWKGFIDKPIFGYGIENFSIAFDRHYDPIHSGVEIWFDHAHSSIFDLLATTGIVGLVAYLAIFFVFFRVYFPLIAQKRPPVEAGLFLAIPIAYFVQNLVLFDTLSSYILFFFFLCLARAIYLKERGGKVPERTTISINSFLWGVAVLIMLGLVSFGIYGNWVAFKKDKGLRSAYTFSRGHSLELGVGTYKSLLEMPGYLGRREVVKDMAAYLYESAAKRDFQTLSKDDATALGVGFKTVEDFLNKEDPTYLNGYYLFANAYNVIAFKSGNPIAFQKTESLLKDMDTKSPNRIEMISLLSDNLLTQKKYDEALEYALRIVQLRPDMEVGHRLAGVAYSKVGKFDEAKKEIEEALRINPSSTAATYLKKIR